MKKDTIQKYSLRKYKGIGTASVLLGMMVVGASPVLAEEAANTPKESAVTPAKDNVKMETLSNGVGSYTMPKMHVFERTEGGGRLHGDENWYEKKHKQFEEDVKEDLKRVEDSNIKESGSDTFKDTKVSFVTKEGEILKEEVDLNINENNKSISSSTLNYKIRGLFGKRYEGKITSLNEEVLNKLKKEDEIIEKNGEKYHKIDTKLEKHEGTSNETTFNDITVHANPENLHNEDGSIRYNNIKEGSRVWLVSEISENHYGKYVLATKTSTTDDSWVVETFKKGEGNAKDFTKENINSEGGIKEGDTILVVEKNEVSLKLGAASTATEQAAYTAGVFFNEKSLYEGLNGLLNYQLRELKEEKERDIENKRLNQKEETWEEQYKKQLINEHLVDKQNRPIYTEYETFHGYIRTDGDFKEYSDIEKYISILKEKFGEGPIKTNWDNTRDKIEPKFIGNIEEFKDTSNYEEEKANVEKFKESHKNIQYVNEVPSDANFVKNVFEVNVDYKLGNKDKDENYPIDENETEDSNKKYLAYTAGFGEVRYSGGHSNYQYGIGQLYKEYTKDGVTYRVASPTKYDQYAHVSGPSITEIHYYNLYQPTRAYHVSEELTKVKNIYAKEEKSTTEIKGNVKVHYQLEDGTSIKESVDVVKDAVVSSTEEKYYLDKDDKKVVVGTPTTTNNDVSYDTTTRKLQEITKDGKKYKLVGLKTGSPAETGKVASGTTEITYVYKLATAGNIFEKYMIEGTNTEIAMEKQLTKEASIGDSYTSTPPKAYTVIKKNGKSYIYKGHRATSAPEIGTVDENEKTVIYDFVEYFSEKGKPEVQPELPEGVVSEKGEPEVQPELPERVVSEKGEPEVRPELPEGVVSEKGEPEVQPESPEGVVSEKGEPEVQPELPEGVVSEKGEPMIHPVAPLLITRHIIIGSNEELIPIQTGKLAPKSDIISKNGKKYRYTMSHEKDSIVTHLYTEVIGDDGMKPQNQEYLQSNSVKIDEPKKQEGSHQDEAFNKEKDKSFHGKGSESGEELPQTGQVKSVNSWFSAITLIGAMFLLRRNRK